MKQLVQSFVALVLLAAGVGTFGERAPEPVPISWERTLESEERWITPSTTTTSTTAPPVTQPRVSRKAPTRTSVAAPPSVTKSQDEILACIRAGEAASYLTVSANGVYHGHYQFDQPTWDGVASRHKPELVGVPPEQASPADQDAMAWRLYEERGLQPWPNRGDCD